MNAGVTHIMAFSDLPDRPAFSGAENHLFTLMSAQQSHGVATRLVMVVVQDGPRLMAKRAELEAQGIDVWVAHHNPMLRKRLGPIARLAVVGRVARAIRERPDDVVHTHLPHASQVGRMAAAFARSRKVVDSIHNDEPAFRRPLWRLRFRLLDRYTAAYIAISNAVRRLLVEDVALPASKVHVVPYGVVEPGPEPDRAQARQALGLNDATTVVGFVGRLTPQKDLPTLLSAVARMPHVTGVIIGGGEEEAQLRRTAIAVGAHNVLFMGALPDAAALMRAFDVFCLPSRWEGLGLVLLEAMWREVPIVASRAGAIPEVLDNGSCGTLFECGDVADLVTALEQVLNDEAWRSDKVRAARQRVQEVYSVEQMVARTAAVYAAVSRSSANRS